MKLHISDIRVTPEHMPFSFCVYGEPKPNIVEWAECHELRRSKSGPFSNFEVNEATDLLDLIQTGRTFDFMDGFSPNLEKALHVGHLSNLVLASALYNLDVAKQTVAIFGDTIGGNLSKGESLDSYYRLIDLFNYPKPEHIFYASEAVYQTGPSHKGWPPMVRGEGNYTGTQGWRVDTFPEGPRFIVGIKNDGSTSYFYQDMALRQSLMGFPTLYLTGSEQNDHFDLLVKADPHVYHLGLGLVSVDGKKMSTREGNVIYIDDILEQVAAQFDGNEKLAANVLMGLLLRTTPKSNKSIDTKTLTEPKQSPGLYLTYTLARMLSCGLDYDTSSVSLRTQYAFLHARDSLKPVVLLERLVNVCSDINNLYGKFSIKDDPANAGLFQPLVNELAFGMQRLGLHLVEQV